MAASMGHREPIGTLLIYYQQKDVNTGSQLGGGALLEIICQMRSFTMEGTTVPLGTHESFFESHDALPLATRMET